MGRLGLEALSGDFDAGVPDNLLPMGIGAILDPEFDRLYPLFVRLPDGSLETLGFPARDVRNLSFKRGCDPLRSGAARERFPIAEVGIEDALLGPPVRKITAAFRARPEAVFDRIGSDLAVIGLIDTGIAFWNPAFLRDGQPILERLAFVEFGGSLSGQPGLSSSILTADALQQLVDMARGPGGDARLRAELGTRHPGSVHAPFRGGPAAQPGARFSHGTAMLDAVLRGLSEQARVIGVELPAEVLADASGAALECVVELALEAAAKQMIALRDSEQAAIKGTVLLPYAFLGGPHDGSRVSVRRLRELIEDYRLARVDLTLVVPMGNHLDDRVHARLMRSDDGRDRASVVWRLLPDDHSSNTVELLHRPGAFRLRLASPDGDAVEIDMSGAGFSLLVRDGRTIGAIWTAERSGWMRTRITLGPTVHRDARLTPAPAGAWRLTLIEGAGLEAWILRDDVTLSSRAIPARRQSFFEDPDYRRVDDAVDPVSDDPAAPVSVIRRRGTASLLATAAFVGEGVGIEAVGATWSRDRGADPAEWAHAVYSGRYRPEHPVGPSLPEPTLMAVDAPRPTDGWMPDTETASGLRATGGNRRFAVSGTSVAAALRARDFANETAVGDVPGS